MKPIPPSVELYLAEAKSALAAERATDRKSAAETLAKANALAFERVCRAGGIDPSRGASPSLYAALGRPLPSPMIEEAAE